MNEQNQFHRPLIYVSLGLALFLVLGVLFGARYYYNNVALSPVAVAPVDSPEADSAECTELIAALPESFQGAKRAEIADPAPAGVAAWRNARGGDDVKLRCGVRLPFQYSAYSVTTEVPGTNARWLKVADQTPGSELVTWYSVSTKPTVAITASTGQQPEGLDLGTLEATDAQPYPAPLKDLKNAKNSKAMSRTCDELLTALPDSVGEGYTRAPSEITETPHTAVWNGEGLEPVVLRCGVQPPKNYKAGERLQQFNDVPWFQDTTLAEGTTAGTWYALGRSTDIAVSIPQDAAADAIQKLSGPIAESTPAQS